MRLDSMTSNNIQAIVKEIQSADQKNWLAAINTAVNEGILLIEIGEPLIVHNMMSAEVELKQHVRFKYKGQEIVEDLRRDNNKLESEINQLKNKLKSYEDKEFSRGK